MSIKPADELGKVLTDLIEMGHKSTKDSTQEQIQEALKPLIKRIEELEKRFEELDADIPWVYRNRPKKEK